MISRFLELDGNGEVLRREPPPSRVLMRGPTLPEQLEWQVGIKENV